MTSEAVTLIAALIAAISSIVLLLLTIFSQFFGEIREAQRLVLAEYVSDLGEAIHETMATSTILIKTKTEESAESWRDRSIAAKKKLHDLIPKLKYPLWGITDYLRTFSRLPDWVEHARQYPEYANDILEEGAKLIQLIEIAIKNSYVFGRTPTKLEILRIRFQSRSFENAYQRFKNAGLD